MNLNFVNNQYYNVIYHIHKRRFKTFDNIIYFACNQFIYLKQVLYKIQ